MNPVLLCACVWCTVKLCVFAGLWVRCVCLCCDAGSGFIMLDFDLGFVELRQRI